MAAVALTNATSGGVATVTAALGKPIVLGGATAGGTSQTIGGLGYSLVGSTVEWRPFTVRRTVGGDVVRAETGFAGALRYGPIHIPFDIVEGTTLGGYPLGYDTALLSVQIPPTYPWRRAALVRGGFGYPNSPLDGEAVWYYANDDYGWAQPTEQYNQMVRDQPVTGGHWYYYTLFIYVGAVMPGQWVVGATYTVLVPRDYGHAEKLYEMIPYHYRNVDARQAADGLNGPLRKFAAVIGYDTDYNRTLLDGILNVYNPDQAPLMFTEQVGANLGMPVEEALGGARYRALVGQLWSLDGKRGTTPGLQEFIYAASNYRCEVVDGNNSLLTVDDSEFVNGPGHWAALLNSTIAYTYVNTVPNPDTVPATFAYSKVVTRKYTGAVSAIPAVPAGAGRGVLEIIDTTTPTQTLVDFIISAGISAAGVTGGLSDGIQFGIPVKKGELWEISFWMCHKPGDVDAQVTGTYVTYDLTGKALVPVTIAISYPATGYVLDNGTAWVKYRFQHIIGNDGDGLATGNTGDPVGYIIPSIWWHSASTALKSRYIMGVMVDNVQAVGGNIQPLAPDIFLILGAPDRTLGGTKSYLGEVTT